MLHVVASTDADVVAGYVAGIKLERKISCPP